MTSAAILSRSARNSPMLTDGGTSTLARAWKKRPAAHRRAHTLRGQLLDIDPAARQHARHLMQDARVILTDQFEHDRRSGCRNAFPAFRMNRHAQSTRVQSAQGTDQFLRTLSGDRHTQQAGKLPPEMAHPALKPVASMVCHARGHQLHQACPIGANHRHHEGREHETHPAGAAPDGNPRLFKKCSSGRVPSLIEFDVPVGKIEEILPQLPMPRAQDE